MAAIQSQSVPTNGRLGDVPSAGRPATRGGVKSCKDSMP